MEQKIAMKNAKKLLSELKKKRHPECGMTKIQGFTLSSSDVDTCEMILEAIARTGSYPTTFMSLLGDLQALFEKSGVPFKREFIF